MGERKLSDSLGEFLDVYDELVDHITTADYKFVQQRLKQWFTYLDEDDDDVAKHLHWLQKQTNWAILRANNILPQRGMVGSGEITLPEDSNTRLSFQLHMFRRFADKEDDILNFSREHFYKRNYGVTDTVHELLSQLFEPFQRELRRFISKVYDEPLPEESEDEATSSRNEDIPASDRIVSINHNSPEYVELLTGLEGLETQLRQVNDLGDEDREQAIAELQAGQIVMRAGRTRLSVLKTLVVGTLKWLLNVIATSIITEAIGPLLKLAIKLVAGL